MKRYIFIVFFCIFVFFALGQSMTISVKGVSFDMIKINSDSIFRINQHGDTLNDISYKLYPIDTIRSSDGMSKVIINEFYISKFEVTQELYYAVMGYNPSYFKENYNINYSKRPVEKVSWYDSMAFIDSLNKLTGKKFRLPTENEWLCAAMGGVRFQRYSGGNNHESVAWGWENGLQRTHDVGQKKSNGYGIYDMSGNVYEWCSDWFSSDFYKRDSIYVNPVGPQSGKLKVVKGGSWGNSNRFLEINTRAGQKPDIRSNGCGFRLAMDIK